MARLGGASHAVPLRKKGEQDMGDEGWLARHGLYFWFLVISGVCLVVNLVDGMVLMSHGPSVGIGVLLVACVVADLWMAVRPRIGCWTVFLVLLAGTLSPVPFPASYLLSCLAAAGFLGYLGIMLGVAACVPGVLYAVLLAVLRHQEYRPGQGDPIVVRIALRYSRVGRHLAPAHTAEGYGAHPSCGGRQKRANRAPTARLHHQ